jgi:hypothetical protein
MRTLNSINPTFEAWTLKPRPGTLNPKPCRPSDEMHAPRQTLTPQPYILNPEVRSPGPEPKTLNAAGLRGRCGAAPRPSSSWCQGFIFQVSRCRVEGSGFGAERASHPRSCCFLILHSCIDKRCRPSDEMRRGSASVQFVVRPPPRERVYEP